ncbi:LPS export ABC transporter permease LptF [Pontivivens insulae]|uniref:Lipopolysaccharide export system permease protein LptF n=1 Tax=Pontivivens insulae TaxID=1639689 RepID=A0A2R8AAY6_9RHOB|nr:LPS export ABC transporter permease LptF [Pontivivens insulae]RED13299.1 lipopolysaccharide export system permease protein [Pontivivens insulae]SPF29391.1 Lipopolysaccharide export system permease protein LptF [Pontivivens insulae]
MRLLDRYVLTQALGPFGFFALIFAGVIWLTQSLRIVEVVVSNAQAAGVFLELSALLLPGVLSIVLPIAAFAATIVAVNRLYTESELVVMMSVGKSRIALARPIIVLGLFAAIATLVLTTYLAPRAERQLSDRTASMQAEVANSVLQEGRFNFPATGLTVFIEQSTAAGEMAGVFIHDTRDPLAKRTYIAERAQLVNDAMGTQLVLYDGNVQTLDLNSRELSLLDFDRAGYNIDLAQEQVEERVPDEKEFTIFQIFEESELWWDRFPPRARSLYAEGHEQLSSPLYALALPLLGAACILFGTYQRGGFGRRISMAIGLAIVVRLTGVPLASMAREASDLAPLMYVPPLVTILGSLIVLGGNVRARKPKGVPA